MSDKKCEQFEEEKNDMMELSWPLARNAFFTSLAIPAHPRLPVELWAMPLFTSLWVEDFYCIAHFNSSNACTY